MNIHSGIAVAVVVFATDRACPLTDTQVLNVAVLEAAVVAELARRIESVYAGNPDTLLSRYVLENILELGKAIVHDFSAVTFLYEFHVEVFEADDSVFLTEFFKITFPSRQIFLYEFFSLFHCLC